VFVKFSKLGKVKRAVEFEVSSTSLCSSGNDYPFIPTCPRHSAARSSGQGCRHVSGGTGAAGAPRPVCRACSITWGWKSPDNLMEVKSSKAQGQNREGLSEGSVEQNRDPTNRNRIRGSAGRTSGQDVAKSISIKDRDCKSGGCARKVVELTSRDLCRVPRGLRVSQGTLTAAQKSAEGIVCAGRRPDREGSSPSGARLRSAVSKGGGNTSPAEARGRYGAA
jgi:hypothetical protein